MKLKQKQTRCQFTWVNMIKLLFRHMILKFLLGSEKNREGAFLKAERKKIFKKKKKKKHCSRAFRVLQMTKFYPYPSQTCTLSLRKPSCHFSILVGETKCQMNRKFPQT